MRLALFWVAVLSCISGQVMILRSTIRARTAHAEGAAPPRFAAELMWAALPALVLAATLAATWRAIP